MRLKERRRCGSTSGESAVQTPCSCGFRSGIHKSTVTGKIKQLNADLEQRKSDQKEILFERICGKEHAGVYDEMLAACENDIKRISQELYDIQNYSETIKKRKAEMKQTVDLIEEIVKEGQISNANLWQLIDRIIIYEDGEGLRIQINLNAAFTEHMIIFNGSGEKQADLKVLEKGNYPVTKEKSHSTRYETIPNIV